jgi:hypothetical protein
MYECKLCKLKYKELIDMKCILCSIIHENKKSDVYNICIAYTDVSQSDIIQDTYDFIILEDKLPFPHEIDNTSKLIKCNPYTFREFIKYCKLEKKYLDIIDKFKIFFTNSIDMNKIKSKRFPLKYKIEKLNIEYIKSSINLSDIQINIDKNINKNIDKNFENLYKKFTQSLYIQNE